MPVSFILSRSLRPCDHTLTLGNNPRLYSSISRFTDGETEAVIQRKGQNPNSRVTPPVLLAAVGDGEQVLGPPLLGELTWLHLQAPAQNS